MNFEAFASRIMDLKEYSYAEKLPRTIKQKRFQIKNTSMQMESVTRKQFAGLNNKRFYFTDGITCLPFGLFLLAEIRAHKKQYKKIHKDILNIKDYLIREEHKASSKCERVCISRSILAQSPTYYKTDSKRRSRGENIFRSTKQYILSGIWQ